MNNIEDRLINIETKLIFQEDTIEKLNMVIIKQQNQIALLEQKLSQLNIKVKEEIQNNNDADPQYEIPPHY